MQNIPKIFIYSLIYIVLYDLPLVNFKHHGLLSKPAIVEILLLLPAMFFLFAAIFLILPRFLAVSFTILLFIIGGGATYFLMNFGKTLDIGVILDILSVESDLTAEYISLHLILYILGSLIVPVIVEIVFSKYKILIPNIFIIILELGCLSFFVLRNKEVKLDYKAMSLLDYPPIKHLYVTGKFWNKYRPLNNKISIKRDLTSEYKTSFNSDKPLTVVLVIGESMRGDINSLNGYSGHNNMPFMSNKMNLVSFPNATSSATSTRVAIPYMLTNAIPPDSQSATNTKGVISIFKHLGFRTSWIGSQGLFGYYDTDYASNALEADYIISKDEVRVHSNQSLVVYDESLLPYIRDRLKYSDNNCFLVIHLIGSHWSFNQRYPSSFGHKFTPICSSFSKSDCSDQEIINSYHNTVVYTDYILNLILNELSDKNAILLYASDHGFSLNEGGIFGNAYEGPNVPKEQLDIEMFLWMSDQFKQDNKKSYNMVLKNQNHAISHDNIFHSLLDCAGVKADFIDPALSVCK